MGATESCLTKVVTLDVIKDVGQMPKEGSKIEQLTLGKHWACERVS